MRYSAAAVRMLGTAVVGAAAIALMTGCTSAAPHPTSVPTVTASRIPANPEAHGTTTCASWSVEASVDYAPPIPLMGCMGALFVGGFRSVTIRVGQRIYIADGRGQPFAGGISVDSSRVGRVDATNTSVLALRPGKTNIRPLGGIDCNTATSPTKPDACVLIRLTVTE